MKIVAINGSPRKGNTYLALKTLQEMKPEIPMQIINLSECDLKSCRGCYVCVLKGEEKCPFKDDRDYILQAILDADGLILASPVYAHMVSGLMKNFIDRFAYIAHRPAFFGKFAMTLTTYSGYGTEEATKYMEKMLKVFGFSMVPPLELKYTPGKKSENSILDNQKKARDEYEQFLSIIDKRECDGPSLDMLIPFGIFKYVSEIGRKEMVADYEYYRDKKDYYYEVKIPFYKKLLAEKIVQKTLRGFSVSK